MKLTLPQKLFTSVVLVLLGMLLFKELTRGLNVAPTVAEQLNEIFEAEEAKGFSGVVMLARGNEILLSQAYGQAGCEGAPALTVDSVFLIGSITKTFTRAGIYKLVEQGNLSLDDPLTRFFEKVPEDKAAITVGQVLEHQAGLDDFIDAEGNPVPYSPEWDYIPTTRTEIIERGLKSTLIYQPGTDQKYSNLGYSLLAAIIEIASGQSYEEFLRKNIFVPAGMEHTGYVLPDWAGMQFAHGCRDGKPWPLPNTVGKWMANGPSWNLRGNGGLLGTAGDLMAWMGALNSGGFLRQDIFDFFSKSIFGTSRTFEERATASAGGNTIINSFYLLLAESDIKFVIITNVAGFQGENYLDQIFPVLKSYKNRLQEEGKI